jgi:uncharacterized membrane protein YfcA
LSGAARVPFDAVTIAVVLAAVFLISFMKGAFGGGFAIIGIPLISLVMDPLSAGALLAPLFIAMDLFALLFWRPSTWSKTDLKPLLPALIVGIVAGYFLLRVLDRSTIAIIMAVTTLAFAVMWFISGGKIVAKARSLPKALAAGFGSGVTTMVAHSGGPPLAMYLLPLGLKKEIYAGTTSLFFTVGNAVKALPWLLLVKPSASLWTLMAIGAIAIPVGVWAGWVLHQRLNQLQLYRACYGLLVITGLKLLWDGVSGYFGLAK